MNTLDKILIGCAVFLFLFTVTMIILFCVYQAVPDTLVECVFGLFSAEAVVTFFIWWLKRKAKK